LTDSVNVIWGLLRRFAPRKDSTSKVISFWDCSVHNQVIGHCEDPYEIGRRSNLLHISE